MHILKKSLALMLVAGSLAACDAAAEIAGDAVAGEMRNAVAAQCEQMAENTGIAAGRVSEVCQCSADTFMADGDLTMSDVNREKIEGIVNACVARTDPSGFSSYETMPTEAN